MSSTFQSILIKKWSLHFLIDLLTSISGRSYVGSSTESYRVLSSFIFPESASFTALDRFGTESKSWRRPIECILFRSKDEEFSSFFFADRQQTLVWPAAAVRRGKSTRWSSRWRCSTSCWRSATRCCWNNSTAPRPAPPVDASSARTSRSSCRPSRWVHHLFTLLLVFFSGFYRVLLGFTGFY